MPTLTIYGDPVGKGRMKCIGARGRVAHQLVHNGGRVLAAWEKRITLAAADALTRRAGQAITGPVDVTLTITMPRPPSVTPQRRPWPISRSAGDIDHHERTALDGIVKGGLLGDDSQVVHLDTWQCYPDTADCPGRLDRPGIVIRVDPLYQPTPDLFGVDP